jgi:hypothetical protein
MPSLNQNLAEFDFHILVVLGKIWKSAPMAHIAKLSSRAERGIRGLFPLTRHIIVCHSYTAEEFWPTTIYGTGSKRSTEPEN